jgi:hypothetical protein
LTIGFGYPSPTFYYVFVRAISPHFEVGEIPGSSSADEVEIVLVKCM